jgi:hypothetical protein
VKVRGKIDLMWGASERPLLSRAASSFLLFTLYQIREVLVPQILEVLRRQLHQLPCDTSCVPVRDTAVLVRAFCGFLARGNERQEHQPSRLSASASHPRRNVSDGTLDR